MHFDADVRPDLIGVPVGAFADPQFPLPTMRHSSATWLLKSGTVPPAEIAGFLGLSPQTLMSVYAHHHPDNQENAASAGQGLVNEWAELKANNMTSTAPRTPIMRDFVRRTVERPPGVLSGR